MSVIVPVVDVKNYISEIYKSLSRYDVDNNKFVSFYKETKDSIIVPFAFAADYLPPVVPNEPKSFLGTLRQNQISVYDDVINKLYTDKTCILSCEPGFGKTIIALACAAKLGLSTTVIVNRVVLMNQWKETSAKFVPDLHINFINLIATRKPACLDLLIVDELHQNVTAKTFIKFMQLRPKYILGLSATPYRYDVWNNAIKLLFGDIITTQLNARHHEVKIIKTGIHFTVKYLFGKLDWTDIITQQGLNKYRNNLIVDCVLAEEKIKCWLILCKRLDQISNLAQLFKTKTDRLVVTAATNVNYNELPPCILLGTPSRLGVGFDMSMIEGLCLASDVLNYFTQYFGRLRKSNCVVLDFVDDNGTFKNHLAQRMNVYKMHQCTINTFEIDL